MWPYGIDVATVSLAQSGIQHIHLVNVSIAVPVVLREVCAIVVCPLASFHNHLVGIGLVFVAVVCSIFGIIAFKWTHAHNIKVDIKLSVALRTEIVAYRTVERRFVIVYAVDGFLV